jgi:acyl-coenzyme A synthetase/AMP-(fatty) acid ligase/3-hydroxymyristoyl/3-hydroxydecanoyl-(acyl carrier protein) dehydratase
MRPLLVGFRSDSVLAWRGIEPLTAGRALVAAHHLAEALPHARYAINLCETLDRFLVAALATLIAGRTLVLPPTRLPRTLAELRVRFPDSVCITDTTSDGGTTLPVDPSLDAALREPQPAIDAWPVIAEDHPAAILFTSGSTGAPQAHLKTWGELADGARALMRSIADPPADVAIIGTVPPQHMFGLETTVMLPLQSATPVVTARPAFAADLVDALAERRSVAPGGLWLMTTPLQLRAFHHEYPALEGIANVIASTMPLDPALASAVERDWRTQVREIYGCTEGGILAVRRASVATAWTPAAGLAYAIDADGRASVSGGHLRGHLLLPDRMRRAGKEETFELVGRDADLVKIAGKRGSLAELTRQLLALAGVEDGSVFLPIDDAPRVAALVVAPGRTLDDLRSELAQRVDAAFLPRPLLLVDALPRTAAGKLPLAALRELVAHASAPAERGATPEALETNTSFPHTHPAIPGHFPGRPIVPGVLLLASVEQLLRDAGLRVVECTQAKFLAPVLPEQMVAIRVEVDQRSSARFEIVAAARIVVAGSLRCVRMAEAQ